MEFRILGPLEVSAGGRRVELGGPKQRALLAVLLVHANEVVSADRLIDELWGESAPPTAAKTLQAHVSRLRRSLNGTDNGSKHEAGPLETRGQGYLLRVGADELDAERFERLLADGRRALAGGDAGAAITKMEQALAVWHGPALADFSYDSFAQPEIARLEELRLSALEERIEAELALGRHSEVVGELEALLARHPLRERLRGQLMLALYRSDRQAEALDVYQRGRRALAEELGLEPSQALQRLERRILEHDAAIAPPARTETPWNIPARAGRVARLVLVAGGLVLAAAAGVAIFQLAREGSGAATASGGHEPAAAAPVVRPNTLVRVNPATNAIEAVIDVGQQPEATAVAGRRVWVYNWLDDTVSEIDAATNSVRHTTAVSAGPSDLSVLAGPYFAADADGAWLAGYARGTNDYLLTHVLPGGEGKREYRLDQYPSALAVEEREVWVLTSGAPRGHLLRVEPATGVVTMRIPIPVAYAEGLALAGGAAWIMDSTAARLYRVDIRSGGTSMRDLGEVATPPVTGFGSIWICAANPGSSMLRIDPQTSRTTFAINSIPAEQGRFAVGYGSLWRHDVPSGNVMRFDPKTGKVSATIRVSPQPLVDGRGVVPTAVATGAGGVWITLA